MPQLRAMDGSPLKKMLAGIDGGITYALHLGSEIVPLNERIGGPFTLRFTGARTCMSCGKRVKKFYGQGLCFPCLQSAPEASECIVRPELCRAHLGEGRDVQWEKDHHFTEHFVYLSQTSAVAQGTEAKGGIKVGVTRSTQVPVRWIDQGAVLAVLIARTPYRQLAGAIEVDLKRLFADKTNWRGMLSDVRPDREAMVAARTRIANELAPELRDYLLPDEEPMELEYPVQEWSPKVTSVSFEKLPEITGTLAGIKGQYLMFKDGRVFNVRSHTGYHIETP